MYIYICIYVIYISYIYIKRETHGKGKEKPGSCLFVK